jgi:ASC-1-like (ASCH) protein
LFSTKTAALKDVAQELKKFTSLAQYFKKIPIENFVTAYLGVFKVLERYFAINALTGCMLMSL